MNKKSRRLNKQLVLNFIAFFFLFGLLTLFLHFFGVLKFNNVDPIYFVGSVCAAAYILSIINPLNYKAFLLGALSSLILAYSLYTENITLAFTYVVIFIPIQLYSFFVWKKAFKESIKNDHTHNNNENQAFLPRFLSWKELLIFKICFLLVLTFSFYYNYGVEDDIVLALLNALFFTTSVGANILLIYKITDAWIMWILFSLSGFGISFYIGNIDFYLMAIFIIYFIVNISVFIKWLVITPKQNYGWAKFLRK